MNSSKVSLFLTLSIILIFSESLIPASCKPLYENVCEDTLPIYRAPCLDLLKGDPKFTSAKDYVDLANNILDLAITKATDGQIYLSKITKGNHSPALHKCATTLYKECISSFKKAKLDLVKNPTIASYHAKVAGDGPDYCALAIKEEAKIKDPAIDDANRKMLLLSYIGSLAARKLVKY